MCKWLGHFITITRHRHCVIRYCRKAGIFWQGMRHDLSKYSPAEFWVGARYYQGDRSPNEVEREIYGYSRAWLHHKGRNKHHFEYWTDYCPQKKKVMPVEMPLRYVAEMFCDRVAASKIYRGSDYKDSYPLAYFLRSKKNRFIHPKTSDLIEGWLRMLEEEGEDAVFSEIRKQIREEKYNGKNKIAKRN